MFRVLLKLHKGEEIKYLSHRDVIRAFEFALRRARIDVAYSSGFNPRPRMSFGSAIGVGVTSDDERIVLELASNQDACDIEERLNSQLPDGLQVLETEVVSDGVKSPLSELNASQFRITLECDSEAINMAIEKILSSDEVRIVREREGKTKEIDIRPYISEINIVKADDRKVVIDVSLRSSDSGGASPKDFVQALRSLVSNLVVRKMHRLRHFHIS